MDFEWDPKGNESNIRKHGIDFNDVLALFEWPCLVGRAGGPGNANARFYVYGEMGGLHVAVAYFWQMHKRHIVSARYATRLETRLFTEVVHGKK